MDGDWLRLAQVLRTERDRRGLSQKAFGKQLGVGRTVIQTIERGRGFKKVTGTLRSVERALGWETGSVESILKGEGPLLPPESDGFGSGHGKGAELPLRISQALTEGTTLDTTIVPLAPNAEMVVVVKGKPAATKAEIRAALVAWEKREGYIERLGEIVDEQQD
ncbi:helix-turn-helix domain-containing protein [Actinacidiphila guanduensis]|jgi:transcriptional regulator with XRE-family HTH domain|uniref:Helix-turn-helix domain-containing protein n=1 Tax=Actinacidiphila guanduensis TaxID=310781 RepID=A0A1H0F5Z6_9ACTN|nr:helix-turn-helix transcriptional regulator [Actinacidiphila guanduensis]SDN90054.1 Helix-turn-helix domain-containing protein [Actinacidiphila guanduensis]